MSKGGEIWGGSQCTPQLYHFCHYSDCTFTKTASGTAASDPFTPRPE